MTAQQTAYQHAYRARHKERDREKLAALKRDYYAARRAAGICFQCKAPNVAGTALCEQHRQHRRERERAYRAAHPESGRAKTTKWRAANKDKARDQQFRYFYGIGAADVDAMLAAQGGRCGICRTDKPDTKMRWHVDHDHATGKVRGILCHKCNMGIGALKDDPATLRAAVAYLEAHQ